MIIGITGFLAAGKEEVSRILIEKYGFKKLGFGDAVREETAKQGIAITRENLQKIGDEMRIKYGGNYWLNRLLEKAGKDVEKDYVFEGIRNPSEIEALKKIKDFFLIGIDAPFETRAARTMHKQRNRKEDEVTLEEFRVLDENDKQGQSGLGQQTQKCFNQADYKIMNDGALEKLEIKVREIMQQIKQKT
jgi:dephospho-CoA kinase